MPTKPACGTPLNLGLSINTGIVAFWLFCENSGTTVADSAGNGNLSAILSPTSQWVSGNFGGPAWDFKNEAGVFNRGLQAAASVPAFDNLASGGAATWVFWIKRGAGAGGIGSPASKGSYFSSGWATDIGADEAGPGFEIQQDTTTTERYGVAGDLPAAGTWFQFAITQSGDYHTASTIKVFINGTEVASYGTSANGSVNTATDAGIRLKLGDTDIVSSAFNGAIDHGAMWSRALTPTEIASLYADPFAGFAAGTPPTVTISASPSAIAAGHSSTLTWSSTDTTSLSIDQGLGSEPVSGSASVSPVVTTIYTATATGPGGSATASVTVYMLSASTGAWPNTIWPNTGAKRNILGITQVGHANYESLGIVQKEGRVPYECLRSVRAGTRAPYEFLAKRGADLQIDATNQNARLEFGAVSVGQAVTLRLLFYNDTGAPIMVTGVSLGGDSSFTVPIPGLPMLAAGDSLLFDVNFEPSTIGQAAGTLTVTYV